MSLRRPHRWSPIFLALGVCTFIVGGCAGLPRIDPTGERFFVCPQHQPAVETAPALGNPQVAPVFTDYVFPQPPLTATAGTPAPGLPAVPQDTLSISPQRVLAPVGSEVILKAGLCTREQYLLTCARIDWMIAREGVGEIVELGGRGWHRDPLLPWNKPNKVDNQFATGYTAKVPLTITRGTAGISDDVQVEPGQAWTSITSPIEGTTHVTAMAPEIETWTQRRAAATIHWVDVQWTFPSATITANASQVLTTTVRRQTDGQPLVGWLVRYEVAEGGGTLQNANSDQVVEVATDANGQASIDVTPTGSEGNTTRIAIQLVRPKFQDGADLPRLIVANGATTIQWSSGGTPYMPPADNLGTSIPADPIPNVGPPPVSQPPAVAAGPPILEVEIFDADDSNAPKMVGGQARFEVVIRNRGESEATNIVLHDRFDEGLGHLRDPNRELEIQQTNFGNVAAGDSRSAILNFDLLRAGQQCHVVTVRSAEGAEASKRACIEVTGMATQSQPSLEVRKEGPPQAIVGEVAQITLTVTNTGDVPLTDVQITDEYAAQLRASPSDNQYEKISLGDALDRFLWKLPELPVGSTKTFQIQCVGQAAALQACSTVQVTADTGTSGVISSLDKHCMDLIANPNVFPSGETAVGGLELDLVAVRDTQVLVGARTEYQIIIHNKSTISAEQVQLQVVFPEELTPDVANIEKSIEVAVRLVPDGQRNVLQFAPIPLLPPDQRLAFKIPANANRAGVRYIVAELSSSGQTTPIRKQQSVTILGN